MIAVQKYFVPPRQLILDENMDPMDLPDLETGFSDTVLGITWHGKATVGHVDRKNI